MRFRVFWVASVFAVGLCSLEGPSAHAKTLVLEQTSVSASFGLTGPTGEASVFRLHVLPLTETLRLGSGRKVYLERNAGVPASLHGPQGASELVLNFAEVSSAADVSGKVLLTREVSISGQEFEAVLTLQMELDLLSLGDEKPHVTVRSAQFVNFHGCGDWKNFALSKTAYLAMPAAPLFWSMSPAQLDINAKSRQLSGEWILALPLSPEAFIDRDEASVVLNVYGEGSAPVDTINLGLRVERDETGQLVWRQVEHLSRLESFRIHWTKNSEHYTGKITGRLLSSNRSKLARISVRVGSTSTPYQMQLIGLLAQK